jgi:hypothetical protein
MLEIDKVIEVNILINFKVFAFTISSSPPFKKIGDLFKLAFKLSVFSLRGRMFT